MNTISSVYGFPTGRLTCLIVDPMYNEDFKKLQEAVESLGVSMYGLRISFQDLAHAMGVLLTPPVKSLSETLGALNDDLWFMVPPKVRHLAEHHPKSKVRNKNWNRMWKIRERYIKCHKQ